jgi:hypothetical protein
VDAPNNELEPTVQKPRRGFRPAAQLKRRACTEVLDMAWLDSRRNQLLLGGSVGALFGGLFAHFSGVEPALVPVLAGFALGQVVAVVAASRRQAN